MHAGAQFDFMHGVEFVWIICISVWILFVAWKRKKMRPQGLQLPVLIGKLIMSLWVGCLRVCVCLWKIQDLSLEAACDRGSSVLLTPLPLLRQNHWWEDRGFAFSRWREIRGQESEPNYRIEFSPNKTLQHVCGNEELCFLCETYLSVASSQQLLTWQSFSLLLIFAPPSMYYCSVKRQ